MIYTTSMYPAAPSPVPAPGVIQWSGYIIPGGFGRDGDDDDNSDGEPNSDWQPLNTDNVPNSKPFVEGALFNSGDVVEYDGKFYIAQNPEKTENDVGMYHSESKILLVYIYIKTENNYGFEKISKSNQSVSRS